MNSIRGRRRHILALLAAISLLLCLGDVAVWALSQRRLDSLTFVRPQAGSGFRMVSTRGLLVVKHYRFTPDWAILEPSRGHSIGPEAWFLNGRLALFFIVEDIPPSEQGLPASLGFATTRQDFGQPAQAMSIRRVYFPHWLACAALALLPLQRLVAFSRRRRRARPEPASQAPPEKP